MTKIEEFQAEYVKFQKKYPTIVDALLKMYDASGDTKKTLKTTVVAAYQKDQIFFDTVINSYKEVGFFDKLKLKDDGDAISKLKSCAKSVK